MSARQLGEWAAFERVAGPISLHRRIDFAAALIGLVVARVGGAKNVELHQFLLKWGGEGGGQSDDEMLDVLKGMMKKEQ